MPCQSHIWLVSILISLQVVVQSLAEPNVFNFASSVAGAKVLASSSSISTAQACLDPDPDRYLLIPRDNKRVEWLVIQLSEDITPTGIELQNAEYYATTPRLIEILASSMWPTEQWALLAEIEVNKTRHMQAFRIETGKLFRYLKIRIKSVHEPSRLCTLTSFKVFGIPAMSRLDVADAGIEQLVSFSHRLPDLPQPVYLEKEGSCPIPTFNAPIFLDSSLSSDTIVSPVNQVDLRSLWDIEEPRPSENGSVYSTLMSRLQTIALRQRLSQSNTQAVLERSRLSLSHLKDQITFLDRKALQIDAKQRNHLRTHSDLLQSSQLQVHCEMMTRALPRLAERAEQFEKDLNSVIYLAIGAAISSAVLLIALFYKF